MSDALLRWDDAFQQRVIEALKKKGVRPVCPMCGHKEFGIAGGHVGHPLRTDFFGGFMAGGPIVPSAVIICNNCGFESHHALGALGLLPSKAGAK